MELVHIFLQFRIGETIDDLAVLDDVVAIRNGRREPEILFFIFSPWVLLEGVVQTPR